MKSNIEGLEKPVIGGDPSLTKKWGDKIISLGWAAVPNALIRKMSILGINPTEFVIICYLIVFWWEKESLPFPAISKMADEIGVSTKTIERSMASLKNKGLIQIIKNKGHSNIYNMAPLIERLTTVINVQEGRHIA